MQNSCDSVRKNMRPPEIGRRGAAGFAQRNATEFAEFAAGREHQHFPIFVDAITQLPSTSTGEPEKPLVRRFDHTISPSAACMQLTNPRSKYKYTRPS